MNQDVYCSCGCGAYGAQRCRGVAQLLLDALPKYDGLKQVSIYPLPVPGPETFDYLDEKKE